MRRKRPKEEEVKEEEEISRAGGGRSRWRYVSVFISNSTPAVLNVKLTQKCMLYWRYICQSITILYSFHSAGIQANKI